MEGTLGGLTLADALQAVGMLGKSGVLAVEADDRHGLLGVREGSIYAASCNEVRPDDTSALDAVVDMLEWPQGAYSFTAGPAEPAAELGRPLLVEDVISKAAKRAAEWESIRAVIPNDNVTIELIDDQAGVVELSATEWRVVCQLGQGCRLDELLEQTASSRFELSSVVAAMAKKGLVRVIDDPRAAEVIALTGRKERGGRPVQGGKYIKGSLEAVALTDDLELPEEWSSYYQMLDGMRDRAISESRVAPARMIAH